MITYIYSARKFEDSIRNRPFGCSLTSMPYPATAVFSTDLKSKISRSNGEFEFYIRMGLRDIRYFTNISENGEMTSRIFFYGIPKHKSPSLYQRHEIMTGNKLLPEITRDRLLVRKLVGALDSQVLESLFNSWTLVTIGTQHSPEQASELSCVRRTATRTLVLSCPYGSTIGYLH